MIFSNHRKSLSTENKPFVDHIDNNRQNNIVTNLRWTTPRENNYNSSISSRNKSGVKGVFFDKACNQWLAHIGLNRHLIKIGYFDTLEEATVARRMKANELYGEFVNKCEKIRDELDELEAEFIKMMNN